APGSTLPGNAATFSWSAGTGVGQYWIYIGSTPGGFDIYNASTGTAASLSLTGLPVDGSTLYVRLWSQVAGTWQFNDYTARSANVPAGQSQAAAAVRQSGNEVASRLE